MSRGTQYWPINFLSLECWQIFLIWSQEKLNGKPSVSHLRVLGDLFNGGKDNPTLPGGLGIIGSWNNPSPLMVYHFFSIVSFLPLAWFWSFSLLRPHFTRSKQQADPRAWPKSSRRSAECWPRAAGGEWDRLTERSRALQQFRAWAAGPCRARRTALEGSAILHCRETRALWAGLGNGTEMQPHSSSELVSVTSLRLLWDAHGPRFSGCRQPLPSKGRLMKLVLCLPRKLWRLLVQTPAKSKCFMPVTFRQICHYEIALNIR